MERNRTMMNTRKDMFSRDVNKELSGVLHERNKRINQLNKSPHSGQTTQDEEDDEVTTTKSLKSPKSPISSRSSMLSAKSPRDDTSPFFNTMKTNSFMKNKKPTELAPRRSLDNSDEDDKSQKSTGRRDFQIWNQQSQSIDRSQSPKSERSDSAQSPRRLLSRNLNLYTHDEDDSARQLTKSPRLPSGKNDFMLNTLKRPLNADKFIRSEKLNELNEEDTPRTERSDNRQSPKGNVKLQLDPIGRDNKHVVDERDRLKGILGGKAKQPALKPLSPPTNKKEFELNKKSFTKSPPILKKDFKKQSQQHEPHRSPKNSRPQTPTQSRDEDKRFMMDSVDGTIDDRSSFDRSSALLAGLLPEAPPKAAATAAHTKEKEKPVPLSRKNSEEKKSSKDDRSHSIHDHSKQNTFSDEFNVDMQNQYEKQLSDIDNSSVVDEKFEDSNITDKLKKQREEKTRQRLERAKSQTDNTKMYENAIEKVENANEDARRTKRLMEQYDTLDYSTKPLLDRTQLLGQDGVDGRSRSRDVRAGASMRTRSLSANGRRPETSRKYKHVKPKLVTRLNSTNSLNGTRQNDEDDWENGSHRVCNDSQAQKEEIYRQWYERKMIQAKENIKQVRSQVKNEEEKKAHELINKLKKSQIIFKLWSTKKEQDLKEKEKEKQQIQEKIKEELSKREEKKKIADKSFKIWKEEKDDKLKAKLDEKARKEKEIRDKKRDLMQKKRDAEKQYESWKKKKDQELQEKLSKIHNNEKEKERLIQEHELKKQLNRKAYEEWLEKKEEQVMQQETLNRTLSASAMNTSLPPFYPTSRTIPYKR